MSEFDSLTLALEEWFDRPLGDLPEALRLRVNKELMSFRWEALAPEQRRTVTLQLDYQHDPATEREREYWWDFHHRMSALEAELKSQESSDRVNLDDLLGTGGRKSEIRTQIERMKARERASKDQYYPQRRVPVQEPLVGKYMAYPKALGHLRQRLKATAEELAAWVWLGAEHGGLTAFLNVNELEPPPKFHFGELPVYGNLAGEDADYVAPLMGCWFTADDVANFQPVDRFITGKALIERWGHIPDLKVEAFVRAKIRESRLLDLHPIYGGTQTGGMAAEHLPPMTAGLYRLADVQAIEAEDFGNDHVHSPADGNAVTSKLESADKEVGAADVVRVASDASNAPLTHTAGLQVGSPDWRKRTAQTAANAKHNKPGGSRDKHAALRGLWASGKYSTRTDCAEQECAALGMALSTAIKALRNTPEPTRN